MAEDLNWAVGGEAGDGIDSTGKIFAQALSRAGRHVFTSKDFASRIRGGYTAYKIRTSVESVQSVVDRLDILVALTQRTIDENLDELHEGSAIIYDGERSWEAEIPDEMTAVDVPLKTLAEEAGGAIMRNIVALGAACEITGFDVEYLDEALEKRFGGKGSKIVENNKAAARAGQEYVQENYDPTTPRLQHRHDRQRLRLTQRQRGDRHGCNRCRLPVLRRLSDHARDVDHGVSDGTHRRLRRSRRSGGRRTVGDQHGARWRTGGRSSHDRHVGGRDRSHDRDLRPGRDQRDAAGHRRRAAVRSLDGDADQTGTGRPRHGAVRRPR